MGYALISGGGTDGRYSIDLDFGSATRADMLARLAQIQVSLNAKIAAQQLEVDAADSREAAALANLTAVQDALILDMQSGNSPDDPAKKLFDHLLGLHKRMVASNGPIRRALATLKLQLSQANAMVAYWNNFSATETRNAWCCDLTEDATGYVATLEIPGEPSLILIAPGGRAWQSSDGVVTARQIMSPAQAFFNAAILPGWQKWLPTYRWGVASDIDHDANTMTVALGDAKSSAQRLNVNADSVLNAVPVSYMTCNSEAFSDGDRVVVQFQGQNLDSPRVVGFLDNPKPCGPFPSVVEFVIRYSTTLTPTTNTRRWIVNPEESPFGCGTFSRAEFSPASTSPIGAHSLDIVGAVPIDQTAYPGASIACSVGPQNVGIWSSAAHNYTLPDATSSTAGNLPAGDAQSMLINNTGRVNVPAWDERKIWLRSVTSPLTSDTLPGGFDSACTPLTIVSGVWSPPNAGPRVYNYEDVIPAAWIDDWLTAQGLMPTISVTHNSVTKSFSYRGRHDIAVRSTETGNNAREWTVSFRKDD